MKRRLNNMLKKIFNKETIKSLGEIIRNTRRWLGLFFIVLLLAIYFNRELIGNYATIDFGLWATPEWALLVAILLVISYIVFNWKVIASLLAMACTQGIMIVNNYSNESYILYERFGIKITRNWSQEELMGFIKETIESFKEQIPENTINIDNILSEIQFLEEKKDILDKINQIIMEKYLAQPEVISNTIIDTMKNHPIITICVALAIVGLGLFLLTRGQRIDPKDGEYVEPPIDPKKIITEPEPGELPWDDPTDTIDFPPIIKDTEEYAPNILGVGCWEREQDLEWADNGIHNRIKQLKQEIKVIEQCVFHLDQEGKVGTGEKVSWEVAKDLIGTYLESKGIESTRVSNLMIGLKGKAGSINSILGYLMKLLDWRNDEYIYFKKWRRF